MEASSGVCSSGAKVSGFATRSNSPSSNESGSDGTIHAGLRVETWNEVGKGKLLVLVPYAVPEEMGSHLKESSERNEDSR